MAISTGFDHTFPEESRSTFEEFLKPLIRPHQGGLFHYTTAAGLYGIIESSRLWATSVGYLNDSQEFYFGLDQITAVLKRRSDLDNAWQANRAIMMLLAWVEDIRKRPPYLVSFSDEPDLLSQWRAYCPKGGYSIEFEPESLAKMVAEDKRPIFLVSVEYSLEKQRDFCEQAVDRMIAAMVAGQAPVGERLAKPTPHPHNYDSSVISGLLMACGVIFKDHSFREELEWRIGYVPNQEKPANAPPFIHFRPSQELIVPFLKLGPEATGDRLPIRSVMVGPQKNPELAKKSVEFLLRKCNYKPLVRISPTPWRSL